MSLKPQTPEEIPAQTVAIVQAAFPHGNTYLKLRDEFETLFQDEQFVALYPQRATCGSALAAGPRDFDAVYGAFDRSSSGGGGAGTH